MSDESMQATILHGPMDLRLEAWPMPKATPGRVVLRVKVVGVCPSGLKMLKDPSRVPIALRHVPGMPGHETAAEIVSVGPGVSAFAVGDRVAPTGGPTCGRCHYCRRGLFRFCERRDFSDIDYMSFAQFMACDADALVRIPGTVSDEEASFAEPLACCIASLEKCSVQAGDDVVVIGAGTMGLLHLQLAQAVGARVIAVEPDERRRSFALKMGAAASIYPDQNTARQVRELTGGRGATAVIVAVGSVPAVESAFELVGPGGTVMLFAGTWPPATIALDPNKIHYPQISVTGSVGGLMVDFERAMALLASQAIEVNPLITARFPLSEIMEAHRTHEAATGYKVLVIP
jgi:L-iditol 2-dehydrogenase